MTTDKQAGASPVEARPGQEAALIASDERDALTQPDTSAVRTRLVGVRLTEAEYAELKATAERFRCSMPDMLRTTWFALKDADAPVAPAVWRAHHIEVIVNGYGQRVHYCHVCGRMGVSLAPMLPCPGPMERQS